MTNILARILLALALLVPSLPAAAQFADQRVYGGTSAGSANAQTLTIANMPAAPPQGIPIRFKPGFANTTAATFTVSGGSGAIAFCKPSPAGPVALIGGELQTTQTTEVIYNGTCWLITSSIDSTAASLVSPPQGYLTPCPAATPPTGCTAGNLVPTADVTVGVAQAVTGIVYVPSNGNRLPIYNGSSMVMFSFTQLTLTLTSSHVANTIYDICIFNNAGTPTIVTGPAWTTSTAGAGNRGTGAGTAQIERTLGFWTNSVSITGTNGASTFPISANQCTMVGTMLVSGANGVLTFTRIYGQSRVWPISNFYNRLPIILQMGDPTATWVYNSATIRQSQGGSGTANTAAVLNGLPEEQVYIWLAQAYAISAGSAGDGAHIGVCVNVTNAFSGRIGTASNAGTNNQMTAQHVLPPSIGRNDLNFCEQGTGTPTLTWSGTNPNMLLTAQWRG